MRTGVWVVTLLWMAGILYTSSLGQATTPVEGVLQTLVSKLGHVVEYAVLGGLLAIAVRQELPATWSRNRTLIVVVAIGAAFAAFDELRQSFVPGREPRVTDVLLDLASVLAGAGGLLWLSRALPEKEAAVPSP